MKKTDTNSSTCKGKLHLIPNLIAADTAESAFPNHNLAQLKTIKYFLVEDIRTARRFLSALSLGINIRELIFEKLDKKTKIEEISIFLENLHFGKDIAVLSESGCPGIADPGNVAVKWAHTQDIAVVPYVGPSSIFLALMASGLNGQKFCFHGYLPIKTEERNGKISTLEKQSSKLHQTQIFIETPYRNESMWKSLLQTLAPQTQLCVALDLMSPTAFVKTQTVAHWIQKGFTLQKAPAIFLLQA